MRCRVAAQQRKINARPAPRLIAGGVSEAHPAGGHVLVLARSVHPTVPERRLALAITHLSTPVGRAQLLRGRCRSGARQHVLEPRGRILTGRCRSMDLVNIQPTWALLGSIWHEAVYYPVQTYATGFNPTVAGYGSLEPPEPRRCVLGQVTRVYSLDRTGHVPLFRCQVRPGLSAGAYSATIPPRAVGSA